MRMFLHSHAPASLTPVTSGCRPGGRTAFRPPEAGWQPGRCCAVTGEEWPPSNMGALPGNSETVIVSTQCAVVGQVIQSGPRFPLETKQYKSHMAYVKCN